MSEETMTDALSRLEDEGYAIEFHASETSLAGPDISAQPEAFTVDDILRFEGDTTDPDDEAAVFVLTHRDSGMKGVYIVAYGPEMDPADMEVASRLGG